jgi:hypothetical protein
MPTKQCNLGIGISPMGEVPGFEECLKRVSSSNCVILLQTQTVLMHSWPLLATYCAAIAGAPVVCVTVAESGYDFATCEHHLKHLHERLDPAVLEQLSSVLSELRPARAIDGLQATLFNLIPKLISVVYNPSGTRNELAATMSDILDKLTTMQQQVPGRISGRISSIDDPKWMERRASHLAVPRDWPTLEPAVV